MNEQDVERRLDQLGKSAPRITPAIVDAAIVGKQVSVLPNTRITACVLTLYNGFTVVGLNMGPVSAENFDPAIGEALAFKDAREQVWPVLGAILAENLHRGVAESALSWRLSQAESLLTALGWEWSWQTKGGTNKGPEAEGPGYVQLSDPGHFKPAEDAALAGRLALAENALSLQGYAFDAALGDYTRYLHGVEPDLGPGPTVPAVDNAVDQSGPESSGSGETASPEVEGVAP